MARPNPEHRTETTQEHLFDRGQVGGAQGRARYLPSRAERERGLVHVRELRAYLAELDAAA